MPNRTVAEMATKNISVVPQTPVQSGTWVPSGVAESGYKVCVLNNGLTLTVHCAYSSLMTTATPIQRGAYVELTSSYALDTSMRFRHLSNIDLARRAGGERHRSTISHLRSGKRKTCGADIARRIERALDVPPGSLFVLRVPNVLQGGRR